MTHDDLAGGAPDVAATAIGEWLAELGSPAPAPGGGAAAAMNAAVGAALVEMVCNLTVGKPRFADHEQHVTAIRDAARKLRMDALGLIGEDAAVFTELMATYRLPTDTDEQKAQRASRIQSATLLAASCPCGSRPSAPRSRGLPSSCLAGPTQVCSPMSESPPLRPPRRSRRPRSTSRSTWPR